MTVFEHQIEQEKIWLADLDGAEALAHSPRRRGAVAVGTQVVDQELGRGRIVLDNQDLRFPAAHATGRRRGVDFAPDGLQHPLQV